MNEKWRREKINIEINVTNEMKLDSLRERRNLFAKKKLSAIFNWLKDNF